MTKGLIKFDTASHWYQQIDGTMAPRHGATLRHARKEGLYPSPTSIDKDIFKNDFLERWKMEQMVIACTGNPRMPHESVDQYAQRVYEISLEVSRTAAEFGKKIHKALEEYPSEPAKEIMPWFVSFDTWFRDNVSQSISTESILVDHDICVAGQCDLRANRLSGKRAIIDYKSQNVKIDSKGRKTPAFYDSWARQLAFYAVADAKECGMFPDIPECISVVIDSNIDALVYDKVWSREEILSAYEDFSIGAYQWFKKRGYWPHRAGPFKIGTSLPMPI